jgi:hypothetical protein
VAVVVVVVVGAGVVVVVINCATSPKKLSSLTPIEPLLLLPSENTIVY